MKRYLIILIAILLGLITYALIQKLSRQEAGVKTAHIAGAVVSFITLMIGLLLLEIGAAAPDASYVPAKLVDGKIIDPEFISPQAE